MKKTLCIILTILTLLSCMAATSVSAADYNAKITLNGSTYTYIKGTYITYVCNMTSTDFVENGQYSLKYPESLLRISDVNFPVVGDSTIYNYKENVSNTLKFNFTRVSGNKSDLYDFTQKNTLVKVKFKVIGKGSGEITLEENVISGFNNASITSTFAESLTKSNYKKPKISDTKKTVYVKKNTTLKVNYGSESKPTWKSSDKGVATVSSTGKVVAKKAGKATITATKDGVKMTCKVTVKNPTVKAKKSTIKVKKTTVITVKNAVGKTKYKTLTKSIAKVNTKGVVTGLKKGTAKIQVTASGVKTTIKIKVK